MHGSLHQCRWNQKLECSFHHGDPEHCECGSTGCPRAHPRRVIRSLIELELECEARLAKAIYKKGASGKSARARIKLATGCNIVKKSPAAGEKGWTKNSGKMGKKAKKARAKALRDAAVGVGTTRLVIKGSTAAAVEDCKQRVLAALHDADVMSTVMDAAMGLGATLHSSGSSQSLGFAFDAPRQAVSDLKRFLQAQPDLQQLGPNMAPFYEAHPQHGPQDLAPPKAPKGPGGGSGSTGASKQAIIDDLVRFLQGQPGMQLLATNMIAFYADFPQHRGKKLKLKTLAKKHPTQLVWIAGQASAGDAIGLSPSEP